MKKFLFMAATAALALSSCSSDEELAQVQSPELQEGAVVFSANTLRDTRATDDVIADAAGLAAKCGFGVFAYEQGKSGFKTYSANSSYPNFMYNQQVYDAGAGKEGTGSANTTWTYEPIKYYSNNEGAKHSFFAYAPYMPSLQPVFTLGNAPAIRYTVGSDEYDLMWAPGIVDQEKPGVEHKLTFNFQHALSKVSIYVAPFVNTVHSTHEEATPTEKLDKNTKIAVRSVRFVGTVASQGLLDLDKGKWTYEATDDAAYQLEKDVWLDAKNWTYYNGGTDSKYAEVTKDMMVIPTLNGKKLAIEIVYDVITTDTKNDVNSSIITNTVTSEKDFSFEAGKAYTFLLDLGMTSVKFDAKVDGWGDDNDKYVDLPNNHYYTLLSAPKVKKVLESGKETDTEIKLGDIVIEGTAPSIKAYECTKEKDASNAEFRPVTYQYLIDAKSHYVYVYNAGTYTKSAEATELTGGTTLESAESSAGSTPAYYYDQNGTTGSEETGDDKYYVVVKTTI